MARGMKLGRKPKRTWHQQQGAIKRREAGEAVREIARTLDVHHDDFKAAGLGDGQTRHSGNRRAL